MKLLTEEEIEAHNYHTISGGIQGTVAGLVISGLMFKLLPKRYPKFNPSSMTPSIKTALFITPPTLLASICAEEASTNFDKAKYGTGSSSTDAIEEYQRWKNLPLSEKIIGGLSNNKYKIIVVAWAASMYGSWKFVDRDPIMTKTQKAVQARMYAQAITVALLLASVGFSVYEQKLHPDAEKLERDRRWEKALKQAEEDELRAATAGIRTNEERVKGKIFRYD